MYQEDCCVFDMTKEFFLGIEHMRQTQGSQHNFFPARKMIWIFS